MVVSKKYMVIAPLGGYTSRQRSQGINHGLYALSVPDAVRPVDQIGTLLLNEVIHPQTDEASLEYSETQKIYIHPNIDTTNLESMVGASATTEDITVLKRYLNDKKGEFILIETLTIIAKADIRTREEMIQDGWFPQDP
ncbi:MAG: hypothetical protein LPK80_04625 [Bacteroidota bacterium]|nr:hypothetical protein [Bacteroidota bacterium]